MRKKISVIGAGNVGTQVAAWCAVKELGDIVIWNRSKERAIGNALDLSEASPLLGFDARIKGTSNLKDTRGSDIIIFTAGSPRKPGMIR
jgi:malate dehydrogenase